MTKQAETAIADDIREYTMYSNFSFRYFGGHFLVTFVMKELQSLYSQGICEWK